MHHLLNPNDVESIKVEAYEKHDEDAKMTSTCMLYFVKLRVGMTLKHFMFELHEKLDFDDPKLRAAKAAMLNEQMDIEEELDEFEFVKL